MCCNIANISESAYWRWHHTEDEKVLKEFLWRIYHCLSWYSLLLKLITMYHLLFFVRWTGLVVAHIAYLFSEHISIRRSINLTAYNAGGNIRKMELYSTLYSKKYIPRDKFKNCNTIPCQIHLVQYYEEIVTKSAIFAMIKRRKDSKGHL